jgi:cell division inhibitor SepF
MGSWRKMGAFLGLVPEDDSRAADYDYPEEEYDEAFTSEYAMRRGREVRPTRDAHEAREAREARETLPRAERGSGFSEPVVQGALAMQVRREVRQSSRQSTEPGLAARPLTVKLTGFGEARIIGERYREGASVILDMTDLSDSDARRVVDFAAGLAFALRGSIDKVTARVFMLLPPHADMSAEDRRAFAGTYARS